MVRTGHPFHCHGSDLVKSTKSDVFGHVSDKFWGTFPEISGEILGISKILCSEYAPGSYLSIAPSMSPQLPMVRTGHPFHSNGPIW